MTDKNTDHDFKWFAIFGIGIALVVMLPFAFMGDTTAARIEACMKGENMQYVRGNCIPVGSE